MGFGALTLELEAVTLTVYEGCAGCAPLSLLAVLRHFRPNACRDNSSVATPPALKQSGRGRSRLVRFQAQVTNQGCKLGSPANRHREGAKSEGEARPKSWGNGCSGRVCQSPPVRRRTCFQAWPLRLDPAKWAHCPQAGCFLPVPSTGITTHQTVVILPDFLLGPPVP